MQTTSAGTTFVGSGLAELRNALSSPCDNLYRHLTDLILALDDDDEGIGGGGGEQKCEKRKEDGGLKKDGRANMTMMMDTSVFPNRRKVKKKRRVLRDDAATTTTPAVADNFGGVVDVCVSHSPVNYTSDDSAAAATAVSAAQSQRFTTMVISDSDLDRLAAVNRRGANSNNTQPIPPTNIIRLNDNNGGRHRQQIRSAAVLLPNHYHHYHHHQLPASMNLSLLSPPPGTTTGLIESDSVTEILTPTRRHSNQRRRRLIKKMAVDQQQANCGEQQQQQQFASTKRYPHHHVTTMMMDLDMMDNNHIPQPPPGASGRLTNAPSSSYSENDASWLSSSDTDDGHNSSDAGRQGDDELSDWYHDLNYNKNSNTDGASDEYMGIPDLKKQTVQLAAAANTYTIVESSDTDMSQSSSSLPGKRLLSRTGALLCDALNRRILHFLRDPSEMELSLGELRKRERKEALRLAVFYHLDVRREGSMGCRCYVLCKTKYTNWVD